VFGDEKNNTIRYKTVRHLAMCNAFMEYPGLTDPADELASSFSANDC
jgi:hypothetical protein